VKIVKAGKWTTAEEWKREVTCSHCETVMEVDVNDLDYHAASEDHPAHYTPERASVECPICEVERGVPDLEPHVMTYLRNGRRRDR